MENLQGKTVAVLGASSEGGTGWRIAELFAEAGAKVFVAARTMSGVETLARKIGGKAFRCDVSREDDVKAFAEFAAGSGSIDSAVNAAGCPLPGLIETIDLATLQTCIETNFYGQLFFVRQMAARMRAGGSITAILSAAATRVSVGADGYSLAKAAAMHMVRYAAVEYAARDIRINAVNPGLIDTPLVASVTKNPQVLDVFLKETPLRRIATADDVAKVALWLAEAPTITGVGIEVDGGMHLGRFPLPWEIPSTAFEQL